MNACFLTGSPLSPASPQFASLSNGYADESMVRSSKTSMQNAWLRVQRMVVMEKVKVVRSLLQGMKEDHREHTEVGAFYSKLELEGGTSAPPAIQS